MRARSVSVFVFALFSAAMLGLAAGAVWMAAALYSRHPLPWLAVPLGLSLAWVIRAWVQPGGPATALLAACATVLAALYVNVLIAGVMIANSMGIGLIDAMRTAGLDMLWNLARMGLSPGDVGWTAAGAALAAWLGWRKLQAR